MSPVFHLRIRPTTFLAIVALATLCAAPASAMRSVGGKEKINSDAGWPDGVLEVANLPSRFLFSSGDGAETQSGKSDFARIDLELAGECIRPAEKQCPCPSLSESTSPSDYGVNSSIYGGIDCAPAQCERTSS